MSSAINKDEILEMMGQRVAAMDRLVQPVIDSLFEQADRIIKMAKESQDLEVPTRRQAIEMALQDERIGYEQDGASGRIFVLDTIEKYLEQRWEDADG